MTSCQVRRGAYGDPATRRRLLQAAWELIEKRGAAMRLADVADRAQVSRQALYLHFRDRVGLLVALVEFMDETLGLEAQILEGAQEIDEALGAAWRNRMNNRQRIHRMIVERIKAEGQLADVWTAEVAADLFYAFTLPGPWRELTKESAWTPDDYGDWSASSCDVDS